MMNRRPLAERKFSRRTQYSPQTEVPHRAERTFSVRNGWWHPVWVSHMATSNLTGKRTFHHMRVLCSEPTSRFIAGKLGIVSFNAANVSFTERGYSTLQTLFSVSRLFSQLRPAFHPQTSPVALISGSVQAPFFCSAIGFKFIICFPKICLAK
jgi:hypothetical protein